MSRIVRRFRFGLLAFAVLFAGVSCQSLGISACGFVTPTYRLPNGYSETYRQRLLADDSKATSKELLNPALNELPAPVPYTPPPNMLPGPKPADDMMLPKDRMPFPPAPNNAGGKGSPKKP